MLGRKPTDISDLFYVVVCFYLLFYLLSFSILSYNFLSFLPSFSCCIIRFSLFKIIYWLFPYFSGFLLSSVSLCLSPLIFLMFHFVHFFTILLLFTLLFCLFFIFFSFFVPFSVLFFPSLFLVVLSIFPSPSAYRGRRLSSRR